MQAHRPGNPTDARSRTAGYLYHEILRVMGLRGKRWALPPVRLLFGVPVRRISGILSEFDRLVAEEGFHAGAVALSQRFLKGIHTSGEGSIPLEGPLLVACNHPGAYDVIALAAAVRRDDLKVISSELSFLETLPAVNPHFLTITPDDHRRMSVVRQSIEHLRAGGALLVFPRGQVEPDPAVYPESLPVFERWSSSLELFLRKAPETGVVLAIAGGVLSKRWIEHPFLRLWKMPKQRQKVAEIFQVAHFLFGEREPDVTPRLVFSSPIEFSAADFENKGAVYRAIIDCASAVHKEWLSQEGTGSKGSATP